MLTPYHTPAMVERVLEALQVTPGAKYIDCTAGEGGHSLAILSAVTPPPFTLCIDLDAQALETARARMSGFPRNATLRQANYGDVARVAAEADFLNADGLLLDLGLSSLQLDDARRGFSFRREAPLDMRFDASGAATADTDDAADTADTIVNRYAETELADIIYRYGEERRSRRIARAIVGSRPLRTTTQLADVVSNAVGGRRGRIHPATRTFQAIRIAVNDELGNIRQGLEGAVEVLRPGGRLAVIAYHSIEDRIVKNTVREMASECICPPSLPICECSHEPTVRIVNRRVIKPSREEALANPRSRSARLRIAERL